MPEQTQRQEFIMPIYGNGWVPDIAPLMLDASEGYFEEFFNVWSRLGRVEQRPGTEEVLEQIEDSSGETHPVKNFHHFVKLSTGEEWFVATCGAQLVVYDPDNGSWEDIAAVIESGPHRMRTFADALIVANQLDGLYRWDGEELTYNLGREKASTRTFLLGPDNDLEFTAVDPGEDGNNIKVSYRKMSTSDSDLYDLSTRVGDKISDVKEAADKTLNDVVFDMDITPKHLTYFTLAEELDDEEDKVLKVKESIPEFVENSFRWDDSYIVVEVGEDHMGTDSGEPVTVSRVLRGKKEFRELERVWAEAETWPEGSEVKYENTEDLSEESVDKIESRKQNLNDKFDKLVDLVNEMYPQEDAPGFAALDTKLSEITDKMDNIVNEKEYLREDKEDLMEDIFDFEDKLREFRKTLDDRILSDKYDKAEASISGDGTEEDPYTIRVKMEIDRNEAPLATGQDIKDALEEVSDITDVIDVDHVTGHDGSAIIYEEMGPRSLTGGHDRVVGRYLEEYRTRLVLAGDEDEPSKLRLSHTGDPSLWSAEKTGSNAAFFFVSPDDGEGITGILNMGDGGVLIGKPSSLHGLFGYARQNFGIDAIDFGVGVASHDSMVFIEPDAFFVAYDGIYRYQSGQPPMRISEPFQVYFETEVDKDKLNECIGTAWDLNYMVSLPLKDGSWVMLVFDSQTESWHLWNKPNPVALTKTVGLPENPFYWVEEDNKVYTLKLGKLTDADESPVEANIKTVEIDLGYFPADKEVRDLYFLFNKYDQPYLVNLYITVDEAEVQLLDRHMIPEGKGQYSLRIPVSYTAKSVKIEVESVYHEDIADVEDICPCFSPSAFVLTYEIKEID